MSQIDSDIATKVMGWHAEEMELYGNDTFVWRAATGHQVASAHWSPSTRIEHAWMVVEHLTDSDGPYGRQKWSFGLEYSQVVDVVATFDFTPRANHPKARDYPAFQASALSVPLAICRAALMAVKSLT